MASQPGFRQAYWRTLWDNLTRPSARIIDAEDRRRAKFLSALVVALIGVTVVYIAIMEIVFHQIRGEGSQFVVNVFSGLPLLGIYALCRSRYYKLGTAVLILLIYTVVYVLIGLSPKEDAGLDLLFLNIVVILVAGMMFSPRMQIAIALLTLAILCVFTAFAPNMDSPEAVRYVTNVILLLVIVAIFMVYRTKVENDFRAGLEQANKGLAQAEFYTRSLIENVPATILYVNPDGIIQFTNRADENLAGKNLLTAFSWSSPDTLQDTLKGAISTRTPGTCELHVTTPQGVRHWYTVHIGPMAQKDTVDSLVLVMTDITRRVEAEREWRLLQQETMKELSTPIIPILEGVIVLPLVGIIDSTRSGDIMRGLLAGISEYDAHTAIIDITGVPMVDTAIANHLFRTIQAAKLKGTRTIITGISNEVAETIVDIGIDWRDIETRRDLQAGILASLKELKLMA